MEQRELFVVPSDYLLGIFDPGSYSGYVGSNWDLEQLIDRLLGEVRRGRILVWGTGAPGNWVIEVKRSPVELVGRRQMEGLIVATEGRLCLVDYDSVVTAAQFSNVRLPVNELERWCIALKPGTYSCRIVQHYPPEEAESEMVFNQTDPHFTVVLEPSIVEPAENLWEGIPGFRP